MDEGFEAGDGFTPQKPHRPTGRSHTGNRGGCPRKQIPEKTERAAESRNPDRPLGFRLWENAMGNRLRNPIRETEVWCLLYPGMRRSGGFIGASPMRRSGTRELSHDGHTYMHVAHMAHALVHTHRFCRRNLNSLLRLQLCRHRRLGLRHGAVLGRDDVVPRVRQVCGLRGRHALLVHLCRRRALGLRDGVVLRRDDGVSGVRHVAGLRRRHLCRRGTRHLRHRVVLGLDENVARVRRVGQHVLDDAALLLRRVVVVVHVHRVLDGAAHCQGAIVVGGGERERREALGRVFDRVVPASGRAGGGKVSDRLGARRRVLCADDRRLADKLIEWSRAERRVGLGSFDVRAAQVLAVVRRERVGGRHRRSHVRHLRQRVVVALVDEDAEDEERGRGGGGSHDQAGAARRLLC
mmetsp:Transcript_2877/g.9325  ORF Transcript_2877/g.9325 Transcript_2877/m.9325 type:complete len:408 (+) Transcript_2877:118-1341(+)